MVGGGGRKDPCGKQRGWEQHKRLPVLLFSLAPGAGNKKCPDGRGHYEAFGHVVKKKTRELKRASELVRAKCGGELQGTYATMEPAQLFSIRSASWKQKSTQGCLERANREVEENWQGRGVSDRGSEEMWGGQQQTTAAP